MESKVELKEICVCLIKNCVCYFDDIIIDIDINFKNYMKII